MRLINADSLMEELNEYIDDIELGISDIKELINDTPTVEAIQMDLHEKILNLTISELFKCQEELEKVRNEIRPQGEWLHNSDRPDNWICSVCNCAWDMWRYESKELKYCPNCGAKMGTKKDD